MEAGKSSPQSPEKKIELGPTLFKALLSLGLDMSYWLGTKGKSKLTFDRFLASIHIVADL